MKITKKIFALSTALCLSMLVVAQVYGAEAVIRLVGYSPQEVHDLHLDTQRSMPLDVIGVGQPVYLKSAFEGTYSWSLVAPDGSSTTLSGTTDREVYLIPDMVGSYVVTLSFTDAEGAVTTDEITITGANYVGVGTVGGAAASFPACGTCHMEKVAEWELTGHADMLERGLDGIASSHYGASCIECHTVGFDSLAVNGGFDDLAGEEGWTFPEALAEGVFADFVANYPQTAQRANIQCESCHGPGSEHKGSGPISVSLDDGVCAYCHWEETHHIYPAEWKNGAHGGEMEPDDHLNSGSCSPCHTAEGFFDVNVSESHESQAPYDTPHGQTCVVCHDPHSAEGEYQLRSVEVYTSIDTLTGEAKYASDGTPDHACDVCHHARAGRDVAGTRPHESHQTDVLNGTIGYRYPDREYPEVNAHGTIVEGRCTGCHMAAPEGDRKYYIGGHTFMMHAEADPEKGLDEEIYLTEACSDCHNIGENLDYHGVQTLVTKLLDEIKALLPVHGEDAPSYLRGAPLYSESDLEAGKITVAQMNAAFNWYVFAQDGSKGIHNPALAVAILSDALADLGGVLPGPVCDINEDGLVNIADVIAILLFHRNNPDDLAGDINNDGKIGISDAIALLIHIMEGSCSDALVQLASAGERGYLEVGKIEGLTQEEIAYIEEIMAQMDLTEEQEAAFRVALYGKAGLAGLPKSFALEQNSPNPFNPATTISYSVPEGQSSVHVRLDVFDIRGRLVRTLVNESREAGTYHVLWDGSGSNGRHLASGVYLYRIQAGQFVKTRKMVLLK